MARFSFPTNPAQGISAFLDAFNRERALGANLQRIEQERQLRELEIARARQVAQDEITGRSVATLAFGAQPRELPYGVEALPGVAGTFNTGDLASVEPGMATGVPGPGQAPVPGVPGEQGILRGHTLRSVTEALGGPEQMAAAMRTPEGRQAVQLLKPVSDEDFERLQKKKQGMLGFKQAMKRAGQLREAGDTLGALGAEGSAYRALYDIADNPEQISANIDRINKDMLTARSEGPLLDEWTKKLAPLETAFLKNPADPAAFAALWQGYSAAPPTLTMIQKRADRFIPAGLALFMKEAEKGKIDADVAAVEMEFLKVQKEARDAGRAVTTDEAARMAVERQKDHMPGFLRALREGKGNAPDLWTRVIFGLSGVAKTDLEQAGRIADEEARTKPGAPAQGQPGYEKRVGEIVSQLRQDRRSPDLVERDKIRKEIDQLRLDALKAPEKISDEKLGLMIDRVGRDLDRAERAGAPEEELKPIRDDLTFFRGLRTKRTEAAGRTPPPALSPEQKKAKATEILQRLFPGKAWEQLTPQQKQRVADQVK